MKKKEINLIPDCKNCWGKCCQHMTVVVNLGREMKELLSAHYSRPINQLRVRVDHRCDQLDIENKCKLFGSEKRPDICGRFICPQRMRPDVLHVNYDGDEAYGNLPRGSEGWELENEEYNEN